MSDPNDESTEEFRYRSGRATGCLCLSTLWIGLVLLFAIMLVLQALSMTPWPRSVVPLLMALVGTLWIGLPFWVSLLLRINGLLRLSEDGMYYRNLLRRCTFVRWDQVVAIHTGSQGWGNWTVRYQRAQDGELRVFRCLQLVMLDTDYAALKETVRARAGITHPIGSYWHGPGWERESTVARGPLTGEFRYRRPGLFYGIAAGVGMLAISVGVFVVGRFSLPPWPLWLFVMFPGMAIYIAFFGLYVGYLALMRRNTLLRVSEHGLRHRSFRGEETELVWEDIDSMREYVSTRTHSVAWHILYSHKRTGGQGEITVNIGALLDPGEITAVRQMIPPSARPPEWRSPETNDS